MIRLNNKKNDRLRKRASLVAIRHAHVAKRYVFIALVALISCFTVGQVNAAITFVQRNYAVPQSPQAAVSVTFNGAQTAGNLNVVVVGWNDTNAAVSSVTDSKGNAYTPAVGPTVLSGQISQSIYYAKNIAGAAANTNIVTVQFTAPAIYADIRVLEYSGLDLVNPVDATAAATGVSSTSSSGAVTTTNANNLIFGANTVATSTKGPGAGFTNRVITVPDGDIAEDRIVSAIGSYNATAPLTSAGAWVMQMVALKASASAADTTPPTAPSNLVATAAGDNAINLAWSASTDNVGVQNYLVDRCQGVVCTSFAQIGTSTGTTYADTGLLSGTSYRYRTRAADAAGNLSGYSNISAATTTGMDTTPPAAPSNLVAVAAGTSGMNLTWTASTDNVGVQSYRVERCQGPGCASFAQIGTSSATTFADSGLLFGTSYSYRTRAVDAAGNLSGYSNISTAATAPPTGGSIVFIQRNYAVPQTPQSTVTVNFANAQTAGNLNIVVVGWNDTTAAVSSVTDSYGNAYTLAVGPTTLTNMVSQSIYYAKNIVGAAANTNTVTVQFTTPANYADIRILEYGGIDPNNPVDVTAAATATSASSNSGAVTTTNAYDLIFGANTVATYTKAPGTGFTKRLITSPNGDIAEDRVVSAVGSYSASAPLFNVGAWVMQMVAFRGAGSAPTADQVGQWSALFTWPMVAISSVLLPTGKVLAWDGQTFAGHDARIWDPSTNAFTSVTANDNIFCAGQAGLADGKIFVAGGHVAAHTGLSVGNIFDPLTETWSPTSAMSYARWYPTVTTLPDGRMLVTAGETSCNDCVASIPEVYNVTTNSWTMLTNASLSIPYYPHMFVLPDGRVINTSTGEAPVPTRVLDVQTATWTTVDANVVDGGSAVMYLPGKILKTGTSVDPDDATRLSAATAYLLDMTQSSPAWRQVPSMNFARAYHNMVILPDGNVLVVGGGPSTDAIDFNGPVLQAELWSPATEIFTPLTPMQNPRLYHSTALLLPDGRVLVAGGGRFFGGPHPTDQLSAEIYSPPYLFKGTRPAISAAPANIQYATNFSVTTPDASSIASVAMIRLGAVTHAFDENQRYLPLTFQQGSGELTVAAPGSANLAPPGAYMLFIVDSNGVPSVASFVSVR